MDGFNLNGYTPEQIREAVVFLEAHKLGKLNPHDSPSKWTIQKFNDMNDKIDNLKEDIGEIRVQIAGLPEILVDKFDCKYASKDTEKIVYGLIILVLVAFFGQMINDQLSKGHYLTEKDVQRIIEAKYLDVDK